jgi:hypothetical protein
VLQDRIPLNVAPLKEDFCEGKHRCGLSLIRTCFQETSETVVALQFLKMNLEGNLRAIFEIFALYYFIF